MLKTLKWIYNLGVEHERERIASILQLEDRKARTFNDAATDMLRDPLTKKEINQRRTERLHLQEAVNHRIMEIVSEIFKSEGEWLAGPSIMYPDEGKKKK